MNLFDDSDSDDGSSSGGAVCSECQYKGENEGGASVGDSCALCGQGTMITPEDFEDKYGMAV